MAHYDFFFKSFIFALLIIILQACGKSDEIAVQSLKINPSEAQFSELNENFSDIIVTPLESNNDLLIGSINDLIVHEEYLCIIRKN